MTICVFTFVALLQLAVVTRGQVQENTMYTWGLAGPQLCSEAVKNAPNPAYPQPIRITWPYNSVRGPEAAYAGAMATFVVTEVSGVGVSVYACGNNSEGVLGVGDSYLDQPVYKPLPLPVFLPPSPPVSGVGVSDIQVGTHTMVLTTAGEVLLWGDNAFGQLGVGGVVPRRIASAANAHRVGRSSFGGCFMCKPSFIAAGWRHSLIATEEPALYSFGAGERGQLGHGDMATRPTMTKIALGLDHAKGDVVSGLAAGYFHSVVIITSGNGSTAIYAWGDNRWGQLGLGAAAMGDIPILSPALVPATAPTGLLAKKVLRIAAGYYTTIITTLGGKLYSCGGNWDGQLGVGTLQQKVPEPTPVVTEDVTDLGTVRAPPFGMSTQGVVTKSGIWMWGDGSFGALGTGSYGPSVFTPAHVRVPYLPALVPAGLALGGSHAVAVLTAAVIPSAIQNATGYALPLHIVHPDIIALPTPQVLIGFTIVDNTGVPVHGLTASSVRLTDYVGANRQVITSDPTTYAAAMTQVPASAVLRTVIAISLTNQLLLGPTSALNAAIENLLAFVRRTLSDRPSTPGAPVYWNGDEGIQDHEIAILGFDGRDYPYVMSPFSKDPVVLGRVIASIPAFRGDDPGANNLYGGIMHAVVFAREGAASSSAIVTRTQVLVVSAGGHSGSFSLDPQAVMNAIAASRTNLFCLTVGLGPFPFLHSACGTIVSSGADASPILVASAAKQAQQAIAAGNGTYIISYCSDRRREIVQDRLEVANGDGTWGSVDLQYTALDPLASERDTCLRRDLTHPKEDICTAGRCGRVLGYYCECELTVGSRSQFYLGSSDYIAFTLKPHARGVYTVAADTGRPGQYITAVMSIGSIPSSYVYDLTFPNPLSSTPTLVIPWLGAGNFSRAPTASTSGGVVAGPQPPVASTAGDGILYFLIAPCNANGRNCPGQSLTTFPYQVDIKISYSPFTVPAPSPASRATVTQSVVLLVLGIFLYICT